MLKLATVFSGIGAPEFALKRLNIAHETIFACDNNKIELESIEHDHFMELLQKENTDLDRKVSDKYKTIAKNNFVKKSYLANYPLEEGSFYNNIKYLNAKRYKDCVDVFVGGSPCQSFTLFGGQKGLQETRGTLFYDFARIIDEMKPRVFIYENVKGMTTHDNGKTWNVVLGVFNSLGYKVFTQVLNASEYGIPQHRRRIFIIGFKDDVDFVFPKPIELKFSLQDFLEDNLPLGDFNSSPAGDLLIKSKQINDATLFRLEKYFLSEKIKPGILSPGTKSFRMTPEVDLKIARPLMSSMHKMHRAGVDNYVTTNNRLRRLTPREALRLMGFTDDFKQVVSDTQMYQQAGNSMVVDVMMRLFESILKVL